MSKPPSLIKTIRAGDRNGAGEKPRYLNIRRESYEQALNIITARQGLNDLEPETGMTPLMICLERYNGIASSLIENGARHDLCDLSGKTALHYATLHHQESELKLLIDQGATLNAQDNKGLTPLLFAISNGELDCAIILIQAGAKIDTSIPENCNLDRLLDAHKGHASYPLTVSALLERRRQEEAMSMTQTRTKVLPKMKIRPHKP